MNIERTETKAPGTCANKPDDGMCGGKDIQAHGGDFHKCVEPCETFLSGGERNDKNEKENDDASSDCGAMKQWRVEVKSLWERIPTDAEFREKFVSFFCMDFFKEHMYRLRTHDFLSGEQGDDTTHWWHWLENDNAAECLFGFDIDERDMHVFNARQLLAYKLSCVVKDDITTTEQLERWFKNDADFARYRSEREHPYKPDVEPKRYTDYLRDCMLLWKIPRVDEFREILLKELFDTLQKNGHANAFETYHDGAESVREAADCVESIIRHQDVHLATGWKQFQDAMMVLETAQKEASVSEAEPERKRIKQTTFL